MCKLYLYLDLMYAIMKILNNNEVDILLKEALAEAFKKFGAAAPAAPAPTANATATVANDPFIGCKFDDKTGARPNCVGAFFEEDDNGDELLTVRIAHIHVQHMKTVIAELNKKYPNILAAKDASLLVRQSSKARAAGVTPNLIDITIFNGKEQDFENILPNIAYYIATLSGTKNGYYTRQSIEKLPASIKGKISAAPTKRDFELAEERIINNVEQLLQKLQDPENLKVMGLTGSGKLIGSSASLAALSIKNAESTGWRLSNRNQMLIKAQLPNATFVTNEWTWNNLFNREVIDKSQFALATKSDTKKKKNLSALNQATGKLGYYDPSNPSIQPIDIYNAKRKSGNLSTQQIAAVNFLSNMLNPDKTNFITEKVYDVANTKLMKDANGNPLRDIWNEEIGYADNLQGLPNAAAQKADIDIAKANGEEYQKVQVVPYTNDELPDILDAFQDIYKAQVGRNPVINNGSMGDKIAGVAYQYANDYICPNFNIQKGDLKTAICNAFAMYFAAVYGFHVQSYAAGFSELLQKAKGDENYTKVFKQIMLEAGNVSNKISKKLQAISHEKAIQRRDNKAAAAQAQSAQDQDAQQQTTVAESEEVIDEPIQDLQESFFNLLDRMDNIYG